MSKDIALNWRFTLEERQRVADGSGGYTDTWVALGQLWGDMQTRGVSGSGIPAGDLNRVRYRVIVRGAPDGDPMRPKIGQRLRDGARALTIDAVTERDASGLYLVVWAQEETLA